MIRRAVLLSLLVLLPSVASAQSLRLRAEEVDSAASRRLGKVKRCYKDAVKRAPNVFGVLQVGFRVAPGGAVTERWITMSTVGDPRLEECVVAAFEGLVLPAPGEPGALARYGMLLTSDRTPAAAKKTAEDAYKRSLQGK